MCVCVCVCVFIYLSIYHYFFFGGGEVSIVIGQTNDVCSVEVFLLLTFSIFANPIILHFYPPPPFPQFQFLLGHLHAPREIENNHYAKFWGVGGGGGGAGKHDVLWDLGKYIIEFFSTLEAQE